MFPEVPEGLGRRRELRWRAEDRWCLTDDCDRMLGGLIGLHKETIKQPLAKAESVAASRIRNLVGRDLRYHQGVLDAFHINGSLSADDLAEAVIGVSESEGLQGKGNALAIEEVHRPAKDLFFKDKR